jgi:hypothetical protein
LLHECSAVDSIICFVDHIYLSSVSVFGTAGYLTGTPSKSAAASLSR